MIKALFTSATGLAAQQLVVDTTANNLANINTTGYKTSQADFQDLLYITLRQPGSEAATGLQVPTGLQIGSGVKIVGTTKQYTEGTLVNTNNQFDLAIEGDGFFQVTGPNSQLKYTRDGAIRINSSGNLVTGDGFLLNPSITIPADALTVSVGSDGTVSATTAGSPNTSTTIGTLTLTRFINPAGLSSDGRNLLSETASSGGPLTSTAGQNGTGLIRQGFLEQSNVDVVGQLINLIQAQRAYEFNTKSIRVSDQMLQDTTDLVR